MRRRAIALVALLSAMAPASSQVVVPEVTAETVDSTVCRHGYTRSVRPGSRIMRRIKLALLAAIGAGPEAAPAYQLDHRVPLILGGHPRDLDNLELQPLLDAQRKNRVERKLGCLVCTGQISLDDARAAIATDWRSAYHHYARIKCRR